MRQICNLIPNHLVPKLARATGVEALSRTFSPWSHTVALLFAQLTGAVGLNDVCDSLRIHCGPLSAVRGATPPSRNNLSHANKRRPAELAEQLFWAMLAHLQALAPGFGSGGTGRRLASRFKAPIHAVDSTVIELVAACTGWAEHRRRKAAAKCHLRIDVRHQLPRMAVIDTAREHDESRARELCAALAAGEIVLFDKAYVDFAHLYELDQRGVFWVTRPKASMAYRVVKKRLRQPQGRILRDDEIVLTVFRTGRKYPQRLRLVEAEVEIDGQWRTMTFITNNLDWAPSSVAELYRCRWQIEVFFKQIKQTLQLSDFLGNSANAVRWQVWTALLCYVLLRFLAHLSRWSSSFIRLWALTRSVLWQHLDLRRLLERHGTAAGSFRYLARPEELWLPGLQLRPMG